MINLEKGQRIDIGLEKVIIGLGWDPNENGSIDFDLDASAFMLNSQAKLPNEKAFVFYNNKSSFDDSVKSSGDDQSGRNSDDGDDETLYINLNQVSNEIEQIVITATIHKAQERKQNFGQVHNAYIRIVDQNKDEEIARYDLDEDFSIETSVEFGRLYRRNGAWKFEALGIGHKDGLQFFLNRYLGS